MIDRIRDTIQSLVFKIKLRKHNREKQMSSMNAARSVGVVCLVDKEANWNEVKKVIKEFQDRGAKVEVMGVFYGNVKPLWYIETLNVTLCTDRELGLLQIPTGMHLKEFISKEFDVLINFSITDHFAPFYIAALSKAKFKIAIDSDKHRNHFDMLLKLEDVNMEEYQKQLIHYLSKINI